MNRKNIFGLNIIRRNATLRKPNELSIEDIPRSRSLPLIGKAITYYKVGGGIRLHEYIDEQHKKLGPIFTERLDRKTDLVFTSDPMLMKALFLNCEGKYPMHILPEPWVLYEKLNGSQRGLFFMDGVEWLENRKIMNKLLLREDAEEWLHGSITQAVTDFISIWKQKAKPSYIVDDLESDLYRLSINVIINVLAGQNSIQFNNQYSELLSIFANSVKQIFQNTTRLYGLPLQWCKQLNLKVWTDFKESVDFSLSLSKKIVLELLKYKNKSSGLINKLSQENMSDDTIIRIVSDLIIASGDTTAYTTLWIFLLLSKNQQVIKEIREKDRSYTNFVLKETMRLYPVAPFLTRILRKDTLFGKYKLKQMTPIITSIYTSGRDEQNFSQADTFLPYRWDRADPRKGNLKNHVPSAALPFALGARSCIGKKIALLQLLEVIDQVVTNFEINCTNSEVNAITSQILMPDKKLDLILTTRNTVTN